MNADKLDWRKAAPYMAQIVDLARWTQRVGPMLDWPPDKVGEPVESARRYIGMTRLYDEPTRMAALAELNAPNG